MAASVLQIRFPEKQRRKKGKLSESEILDLATRMSATDIGMLDGTSCGTISAFLRTRGVRAYDGRSGKSLLTLPAIMEMLQSGCSLDDIARKDGTSTYEIVRCLRKFGLSRYVPEVFGRWDTVPKEIYRVGKNQSNYWRLMLLTQLGKQCVVCGVSDYRALQINHIRGCGFVKASYKYSSGGRCAKSRFSQFKSNALGIENLDLEVRCANCNLLHEYERGQRSEITAEQIAVAREFVASVDSRLPTCLRVTRKDPNYPEAVRHGMTSAARSCGMRGRGFAGW